MKKLLAIGAAASLGLAACGGDDVAQPAVSGEAAAVGEETTTTTEAPAAEVAEASADDPASTLRATLTSLLQEHVHLTGPALQSVLVAGEDDPATQAALAAVEENTVAVGEVMGGLPGIDDADALTDRWRDHVDAYVAYAAGTAEGDDAAVDEARAELESFQQDVSQLLDEATEGELLADEVFGELETHTTMVTDVVDAMAEEDPEAFSLLRDAADHTDALALTLADGFASAHEDELAGDPQSVPAETRAELTSALQEHVHLAVLATQQAAATGDAAAPEVQAVVTLLQGSAEDLGNTVGSAVGNDARDAFNDVWRPHVDALLAYAEARVDGDEAATTAARSQLDSASAAVAGALGELTGVDVGAQIATHVETTTAAIDAAASGDPAAPALARAAGQVMPGLAAALAPAIAQISAQQDAAEGQGSEGGATTGGAGAEGTESAGESGSGGAADGAAGSGEASGGSGTEDAEPPSSPAEASGPEADGG